MNGTPKGEDAVEREETPVFYARANGGPTGAPEAFARLEAALGGPRGRRFYGWLFRGEYRACVVRRTTDDASALGAAGLEEGTLAAGRYARAKHSGPFSALHETFRVLEQRHAGRVDAERADLEDYRREGEVWALLPVRS